MERSAPVPSAGGAIRADGDGPIGGRVEELASLLDSHRPLDSDEAAHLAASRSLLTDPGTAALVRTTWEPGHVTASGLVVSRDGIRLLLVWHARLNRWLQPGGHVEASDASVENAARREVAEETGLASLQELGFLDVDVHQLPARGEDPPHRHFDFRFAFRMTEGTPRVGAGVSAIQWVSMEDLDGVTADRGLIRAAAKLRESSLLRELGGS